MLLILLILSEISFFKVFLSNHYIHDSPALYHISDTLIFRGSVIIVRIFQMRKLILKDWVTCLKTKAGERIAELGLTPPYLTAGPPPNDIPLPLGTFSVLDMIPNRSTIWETWEWTESSAWERGRTAGFMEEEWYDFRERAPGRRNGSRSLATKQLELALAQMACL